MLKPFHICGYESRLVLPFSWKFYCFFTSRLAVMLHKRSRKELRFNTNLITAVKKATPHAFLKNYLSIASIVSKLLWCRYKFRRMSCDADPKLSLDARRMFQAPRMSFDTSMVSLDAGRMSLDAADKETEWGWVGGKAMIVTFKSLGLIVFHFKKFGIHYRIFQEYSFR